MKSYEIEKNFLKLLTSRDAEKCGSNGCRVTVSSRIKIGILIILCTERSTERFMFENTFSRHFLVTRIHQKMKGKLKAALRELGAGIGMPEKSDKAARNWIHNNIFLPIEKYPCSYTINRTRILGSAEKRTGIWVTMDYDCVIFVNKEHPIDIENLELEWKVILDDWEEALVEIPSKQRFSRGIKICHDGLDVDLLIAFAARGCSEDYRGEQMKLRDIIRELPSEQQRIHFSDRMSASLNELDIFYMRKQNAVCHELARIAKLWFYFNDPPSYYVKSMSTLIELLVMEAIKRCQDENDILEGFKKFLGMIIDHQKLQIGVKETNDYLNRQSQITGRLEAAYHENNPYNDYHEGENVKRCLDEYKSKAEKTLSNIVDLDQDPMWFSLLKALCVTRVFHGPCCGGEATEEYANLAVYVAPLPFQVMAPRQLDCPKGDSRLMKFICFNAAFVPRNKNHTEGLRKSLNWIKKWSVTEVKEIREDHFDFVMEYPSSNGRGIRVAALPNSYFFYLLDQKNKAKIIVSVLLIVVAICIVLIHS